jgi:hypothetical protein
VIEGVDQILARAAEGCGDPGVPREGDDAHTEGARVGVVHDRVRRGQLGHQHAVVEVVALHAVEQRLAHVGLAGEPFAHAVARAAALAVAVEVDAAGLDRAVREVDRQYHVLDAQAARAGLTADLDERQIGRALRSRGLGDAQPGAAVEVAELGRRRSGSQREQRGAAGGARAHAALRAPTSAATASESPSTLRWNIGNMRFTRRVVWVDSHELGWSGFSQTTRSKCSWILASHWMPGVAVSSRGSMLP